MFPFDDVIMVYFYYTAPSVDIEFYQLCWLVARSETLEIHQTIRKLADVK